MSVEEKAAEEPMPEAPEEKPPEEAQPVEAPKPTLPAKPPTSEVKAETWKKWARYILETLREPKTPQALYEKAGGARISRKRVDSIVAILEEAGAMESRNGNLSLAGMEAAEAGVTVPSLEADKLREELRGKDVEVQGLRSRVTALEAEVESLKAGIKGVECVFLRPLDVVGNSGQRLFHCLRRRLTLGERANICLICEYRTATAKTEKVTS